MKKRLFKQNGYIEIDFGWATLKLVSNWKMAAQQFQVLWMYYGNPIKIEE